MRDDPTGAAGRGIQVLVADDDEATRVLLVTVLRATDGVARVFEAVDGIDAVEAARGRRLDVAVLDLNMPRLDGLEAAVRLRALQPWLQVAIDSADAPLLYRRGAGLGFLLFDKLNLDRLLEWVERLAENEPRPACSTLAVTPASSNR